ncbi:MAG: ribbon-helix-helix domain-containing protein [Chloroflexi bacterium]|nr:ribbon-helix-helix domain-containing protein [Chloroflexota bacterium]
MRTTITIDDQVYRDLKARAGATGRTVGALIEDAVRDSLRPTGASAVRPFRPLPVSGGGGLMPGVDLDDNAALRELMDEGIPLHARR